MEPSAEALLARDDIEAVIIATPHSTHLPLTLLVGSRRQARLPREADGRDPRGMRRDDRGLAGPPACHLPSTTSRGTRSPRTAKRLLDEGAIGELRMVRVLSSVIGYLPDDHGWATNPEEGGAWLDMGVHMFDALRWFTDSEVDLVFARIRDFGGMAHQRAAGWPRSACRTVCWRRSWSAWRCRPRVSARRANGR